MCEPVTQSTNLPDSTTVDESRVGYRLTAAGIEAFKRSCEEYHERKRRRLAKAREARARGCRFGTVCGRWRGEKRVADLRMSGLWLEAAGFMVGQEYEVEVDDGKLVIVAV